jgi:Na+-transporting NADH:ubiquinone oxidoreductase subunit NqrB
VRPHALDDLRYGPYLRLTATIFAALGMIVGVVGLLASLIGADVFIRLLPLLQVDGVAAGLLGLVAMPIFFALIGALVGAVTFVPFRWLQRVLGTFEPRPGAGEARSERGARTR